MKVGDLVRFISGRSQYAKKPAALVLTVIGKGCPVGNIKIMWCDNGKVALAWSGEAEVISESR